MGDGADYQIEEAYESAYEDFDEERERLLEAWGLVKKAMAGALVNCPVCGHRFRKLRAAHVFCRHKGKGNCKDRFWNTVNNERRERAILMNE